VLKVLKLAYRGEAVAGRRREVGTRLYLRRLCIVNSSSSECNRKVTILDS